MARERRAGIVFDESHLEWTALQRGREGWDVVASGREGVAAGATGADGGAAAHPALGALKALAPRLRGGLSLGLATDQVLLRVLRLPAVDAAELRGMVTFQAEKLSPFPIDSMVVGFEVLRREDAASVVLVAAVRTDVVERQGAVLAAAGLAATRVDVAVLGWWRAWREAGRLPAHGLYVAVLLTPPAPQVLALRDGLPVAIRTLPGVGFARDDAAELGRELGFTLMSLELEQGPLPPAQVHVWLPGEPDDFWRQALETACGLPVTAESLESAAAFSDGLARRATEADGLDLTPDTWRQQRAARGARRQLVRAAAAVLAIWAVAVGAGLAALAVARGQLARLEAERADLQGSARAVRETKRRVFMVRQYLDDKGSALECLRALSELMPPGVELTSFAYEKGEEVKVSGEAPAVNPIYEFKTRLDASPLFPAAVLTGPRQAPNGRQVFDLNLRIGKGDT